MRGNENNLKSLKEALRVEDENGNSDYKRIQNLLKKVDSNCGKYYLGIRDKSYNIYYKSMSMARIELDSEGECKYVTSYWYVKNTEFEIEKDDGYVELKSQDFWNPIIFNNIKAQIHTECKEAFYDLDIGEVLKKRIRKA